MEVSPCANASSRYHEIAQFTSGLRGVGVGHTCLTVTVDKVPACISCSLSPATNLIYLRVAYARYMNP
jgi:hypothetical protein